MRGHTVGEKRPSFASLFKLTPKERAMCGRAMRKKKMRREFWERFKATHQNWPVPSMRKGVGE